MTGPDRRACGTASILSPSISRRKKLPVDQDVSEVSGEPYGYEVGIVQILFDDVLRVQVEPSCFTESFFLEHRFEIHSLELLFRGVPAINEPLADEGVIVQDRVRDRLFYSYLVSGLFREFFARFLDLSI